MKYILILLVSILTSCSIDTPVNNKPPYHEYDISWYSTFKTKQLSIVDSFSHDTIFMNNRDGDYIFELKRGNKYHININQDGLDDNMRKYTAIRLIDRETGKILDSTTTNECLKNWGYYITPE